jgi:septum formation protein
MKLILASQSPRRKRLLEDANIPFEIVIVPTDEQYPAELDYTLVPEYIAKEKAKAVAEQLKAANQVEEDTIILAADTIVVLKGNIIGKPKDRTDAIHILNALSGKMHEVITGVSLLQGTREESFHSLTKVHFNQLTQEQIEFYIDNYKPFDKAGSYAIQEWIGLIGISKIEGDLYNVIGLPINKVAAVLNSFSK